MPIIIAAIGIAATVYFFVMRARNAAEIASELMDVAGDVRAAARRFGFKRRTNIHPLEAVDDPMTATATIAVAYLDLDGYPSAQAQERLMDALRTTFEISETDAQELMILGRWLMQECQGAQPAISRGARRLYKLSGGDDFGALMQVIGAASEPAGLTDRQCDALDDLKRAFHIR